MCPKIFIVTFKIDLLEANKHQLNLKKDSIESEDDDDTKHAKNEAPQKKKNNVVVALMTWALLTKAATGGA